MWFVALLFSFWHAKGCWAARDPSFVNYAVNFETQTPRLHPYASKDSYLKHFGPKDHILLHKVLEGFDAYSVHHEEASRVFLVGKMLASHPQQEPKRQSFRILSEIKYTPQELLPLPPPFRALLGQLSPT